MDRNGVEGKVALVTGAARGIGEAVARALTLRGAHIAAVDTDATSLRAVATDLADRDQVALPFPTDVRDSAAVAATVDRVEAELGPVEILVNAAGVLRTGPVVDLSDDDWAAVFGVNTDGVFHVSRTVGQRMSGRKAGCIVTVTSNAAGVPRMHMAAYAASKAATTQFTKCLALELAPYGIRCNVVSPGSTDTAMLRSMWTPDHGPEATLDGSPEEYRVGIPLRKLAQPAEVAEAVAFFASDQSSHITMQDLYVDGGAALRS